MVVVVVMPLYYCAIKKCTILSLLLGPCQALSPLLLLLLLYNFILRLTQEFCLFKCLYLLR